MERANGAETLARVADSLNGPGSQSRHAHPASLQPAHLQQSQQQQQQEQQQQKRVVQEKASQLHLASDDAVVLRSLATRSWTLLPQRDARFASQTLALGITSSTIISDVPSPQESPVEFTAEPVTTASNVNGGGISSIPTFDPSRLRLKVQPPAELARDSWSRSASFLTAHNASQYVTSEESTVHFRFRLRLGRSATTPTTSSFPRTDRNGAISAAPEPDQGLGQVLFLSAESPDKLVEAIESPHSSIATSELASLEGISRVQVTPSTTSTSSVVTRGPSECDFNWTWKSLSRSNIGSGSRCCCAFVEMRPDAKTATLLATMSIFIKLPSPAPTNSSLLTSVNGPTPSSKVVSRSDSLCAHCRAQPR